MAPTPEIAHDRRAEEKNPHDDAQRASGKQLSLQLPSSNENSLLEFKSWPKKKPKTLPSKLFVLL